MIGQTDFNTKCCGKKTTIETTRAIWSKPLFAPCVALDQFNHDVYIFHGTPPQQFDQNHYFVPCALPFASNSTDFFPSFWKTWRRPVFYKLVEHCPHHHCAKKASIATTPEQSVIVTPQLLAAGSCNDDVTIGQYHINDWCTEYTESEILGRYCSMSARNLRFRWDSGYFLLVII